MVVPPGERGLAELATRQHDTVSTDQLTALGFTKAAIKHRLNAGRLVQIHRGVYLIARTEPTALGRDAAALHAAAPALGFGRTATNAWSILPHWKGEPHVLVRHDRRIERPGIKVHRTTTPITSADRRTRHGLPIVSPALAVLQVAATRPAREAQRAAANAYMRNLAREEEFEAVLERHPRHAGTQTIRDLLRLGLHRTRSNPERAAAELIAQSGLVQPEVNATVLGLEVDLWWPAHLLVVEVDSVGTHELSPQVAVDRARELTLRAAGIRVDRIEDVAIDERPFAVVASLARALSEREAALGLRRAA